MERITRYYFYTMALIVLLLVLFATVTYGIFDGCLMVFCGMIGTFCGAKILKNDISIRQTK